MFVAAYVAPAIPQCWWDVIDPLGKYRTFCGVRQTIKSRVLLKDQGLGRQAVVVPRRPSRGDG